MYAPIEKALNFKSEDLQSNKEEKKKIVLRLLHSIIHFMKLLSVNSNYLHL